MHPVGPHRRIFVCKSRQLCAILTISTKAFKESNGCVVDKNVCECFGDKLAFALIIQLFHPLLLSNTLFTTSVCTEIVELCNYGKHNNHQYVQHVQVICHRPFLTNAKNLNEVNSPNGGKTIKNYHYCKQNYDSNIRYKTSATDSHIHQSISFFYLFAHLLKRRVINPMMWNTVKKVINPPKYTHGLSASGDTNF